MYALAMRQLLLQRTCCMWNTGAGADNIPMQLDLSCRMCSSEGVWLTNRRVILAGPCAAAGRAAVRSL